MRNKVIAIIAMLAMVCIAWVTVLTTSTSQANHVEELVQKIEANNEVKTYKNNLPLYEELIKTEPNNLKWYTGLADVYLELEQYGNYKKQCEQIVQRFPQEKEGHLRLIKYYNEIGKAEYVISTYKAAPEAVQADEEFLSVYKQSEWEYRFLAKGYSGVGTCTGGTYVVEYNGVYGYRSKDISGEIEPKFTVARPFIEDYAAVFKDNEWYFIDGSGDRVLASKEKFEDLYSLSEGYAVAKMNGKYGYVDSTFNTYSFEYEDATSFYNDVAAVKKNGKWGLINRNFEAITAFEYDDVVRDDANICSRKGVIFLRKGDGYYMVGRDGVKIVEEPFQGANLFYSDYAAVQKDEKWGFIDREGNVVIDFIYDGASSFASDIAAVKKAGQWGCITKTGEVLLDFDYGDAMVTADNGIVVLKIGELYRFVQFIKYD